MGGGRAGGKGGRGWSRGGGEWVGEWDGGWGQLGLAVGMGRGRLGGAGGVGMGTTRRPLFQETKRKILARRAANRPSAASAAGYSSSCSSNLLLRSATGYSAVCGERHGLLVEILVTLFFGINGRVKHRATLIYE